MFRNPSEVTAAISLFRSSLDAQIEHCVFRENLTSVHVGAYYNCAADCTIDNCLFVGVGDEYRYGVSMLAGYYLMDELKVTNCTFDQFGGEESAAIMISKYGGDAPKITILRNVFSHCYFGIYGCTVAAGSVVDYSGLYEVESYYTGLSVGPHYVWAWQDPFDTNANGSYYLKSGCPFRNYGGITAPAAGLSTRTTTAAIQGEVGESSAVA